MVRVLRRMSAEQISYENIEPSHFRHCCSFYDTHEYRLLIPLDAANKQSSFSEESWPSPLSGSLAQSLTGMLTQCQTALWSVMITQVEGGKGGSNFRRRV